MKTKAILFTLLVSMLMTFSVVAVSAADQGDKKDPEKIITIDSDARTLSHASVYALLKKMQSFYKNKMDGDLDDKEKEQEKKDEKKYKRKPGTKDRLQTGGIFYNETSKMYQVDVWGQRKLVEQKLQTAETTGNVGGVVAAQYYY